MFVVFISFSACPHLYVYLRSPWFYVTAGVKICDHLRYKLARGSHVFSSQENKSCRRSICADVYPDASGYFHPNFHYRYILRDICGSTSWSDIRNRSVA